MKLHVPRLLRRAHSVQRAGVDDEQAPASVAARSASLMRGGVAPQRVLSLLASSTQQLGPVNEIADDIRDGMTCAQALASQDATEWHILAAAWQLSEASGAPMAPALQRISLALHDVTKLRERRSVLLAGPKATIALVSGLPVLAIALGWLLGFDPLASLLSPIGAVLGVVGVLLLSLGIWWANQLTASVAALDRVSGVEFELTWIGLAGGCGPAEALVRVVDVVDQLGARWIRFAAFRSDAALWHAVQTASEVGAPLGPLLLEEAKTVRSRDLAALERAAEKLGVRVLIPLGVCVLPSFVLMGVVPVVMSMLSAQSW